MLIIGYISSILMGLSLGMIGGGGSILTVPILVYLFGIPPTVATAYSLFIVGLTAFVGGLSYYKKGEVDLKTGFLFAVPSFIGVYLTRAYLIPQLPDPVFEMGEVVFTKSLLIMLAFAILMLAASFSMIKNRKNSIPLNLTLFQKSILIAFEGFIVGGVTGFVGAGGGFLIIPALVILVGLPMKIAIGTSLFIIATKSLIGFIGDLQQNLIVDWTLLLSISIIAIIGLFFGILFSKKIPDSKLKKGFGYFVLIMGTIILLDQIRSQF